MPRQVNPREPKSKTITIEYKTLECQRRANANYENKFKRINCRLEQDLYDKITATGESANSVIIKALEQYFAQIERDKAEKSQD